jgi:very-short-patch-repair endonuclease
MLERARRMRRGPTVSEAILWERVRGNALGPKFRRQHVAGLFIFDFYCAAARLVVEVDGAVHRGERVHLDRLRDEALVASGLRVLRVTASEVERDVDSVLLRIRSLL